MNKRRGTYVPRRSTGHQQAALQGNPFEIAVSSLGNGIRRADVGACAAVYAGVRVNDVYVRALRNRADGAFGLACAALDAGIGDLVGHDEGSSPRILIYMHNCSIPMRCCKER